MRIYYITSGYRRPIDILDNALIKALLGAGYHTDYFLLNRKPTAHLLPDIRRCSPDLVITICGPKSHLPVALVSQIKAMGIPTAAWFVDDPYTIDYALEVAAAYDYVFTIDSGCIPFYQARGCRHVHHLPLGTDTDIFRPYAVHPTYNTDVCFIGTGYDNRIAFMKELLQSVDRQVRVQLIGHFWDRADWSKGCAPIIRSKWINFTETPRYYNGAKIVLNIHRSESDTYLDKNHTGAPAHSINNRTFDIAACRAFQLIDFRSDLSHYYEPDVDVGCFESPREGAELIQRYLHDTEVRQIMAQRAYERTVHNCTFRHRIESMLSVIVPAGRC
ncbi:DUF3880 domain-containing protein [Paenibacillus sp. UMB4589-SE434]|uniref:CgeB family protein n=1 Tax=Paenibacillus sp. UMB4589-SE434 TaxID=3046314 RepID=UPI00254CB03C|nr:DUF3880 domain-containing protein [Paenibacillus sp. UMB4589-SE434]MDK8181210.1 DUF3880 domain-containing protein [Paenibacillus sp. UMB4589-SE434]